MFGVRCFTFYIVYALCGVLFYFYFIYFHLIQFFAQFFRFCSMFYVLCYMFLLYVLCCMFHLWCRVSHVGLPIERSLDKIIFALQASADYGFGYTDSPRAQDGSSRRGGDFSGPWGATHSHAVDEYGWVTVCVVHARWLLSLRVGYAEVSEVQSEDDVVFVEDDVPVPRYGDAG